MAGWTYDGPLMICHHLMTKGGVTEIKELRDDITRVPWKCDSGHSVG